MLLVTYKAKDDKDGCRPAITKKKNAIKKEKL